MKLKILITFLFSAFLFLLSLTEVEAATYWIAKGGTATTCINRATDPGLAESWGDLQGISCAQTPGDTVYLKQGTYGDNFVGGLGWNRDQEGVCYNVGWVPGITYPGAGVCPANGAPGAYITVSAAPGHRRLVTIKALFGNSPMGIGGKSSYIKFAGFVIDGDFRNHGQGNNGFGIGCHFVGDYMCYNSQGVKSSPSFIIFEDNEVFDTGRSGVFSNKNSGDDSIFRFNHVHHNGQDPTRDHGFYVAGDRVIYEYNEVNNNADFGMQVYANVPEHEEIVYDTITRYNYFHHNHADAYTSIGGRHYTYGNVSYRDGGGFRHDEEWNRGNPFIPGTSFIYNNTVIEPVGGLCVYRGTAGWTTVLKNNLCVGGITTDFTGGAVTPMGTDTENHNIHVQLSAFVNPTGGNFQLASGTNPAVDQGLTLANPALFPPGPILLNIDAAGTTRIPTWDAGACERSTVQCPNLSIVSLPPVNIPVVTIQVPTPAATFSTGTASTTLSGTASVTGGETITSVTCVNSRGGTCTLTGTTKWSTTVTHNLSVGPNRITISATASGGQVGTDIIDITYTPPHPGNALVAAYGFEAGSGTSAIDSSGNANNGVLTNGPTWAGSGGGKFGNAIIFDGVNDSVVVADSTSLDLTQSFTLSGWFFPTSVITDFRAGIVKNYVQYLYPSALGIVGCSSGAILGGYASAGVGHVTLCHTTPLATGIWTHVAVTYDGATLKIFRDGVQVATLATTGLMEPTSGSLQIGASEFGENFPGRIDEVRVYNYAIPLTAGSNTSPGAACVFGNPLDTAQQSIVRDMNCPVIDVVTIAEPAFKIPASATALKVQSGASPLKLGTTP